jgi:hypothetical protein
LNIFHKNREISDEEETTRLTLREEATERTPMTRNPSETATDETIHHEKDAKLVRRHTLLSHSYFAGMDWANCFYMKRDCIVVKTRDLLLKSSLSQKVSTDLQQKHGGNT